MIDNFDNVESLVSEMTPNDYMFIMIVTRKKDHEYDPIVEKCIKNYFISSWNDLMKIKDEIIALCETFGARAYINLNVKYKDELQNEILCQVAENVKNHNVMSPHSIIAKANAKTLVHKKRWLIDIDAEDLDHDKEIIEYACSCTGIFADINDFIIKVLRSKTGYHYITKPFNLKKFRDKWTTVDVHKNDGGALLYMA